MRTARHNSPDPVTLGRDTYRALVRLLASVPPHVDHQHILRFEGLLLPRAGLPAAHELLLLPVDMLIVDVLPGDESMRVSPGASLHYLVHSVQTTTTENTACCQLST